MAADPDGIPTQETQAPPPLVHHEHVCTDPSHHHVVQAISNKIGRNEPCPCGSGKKHKKCCLS